MDQIFSTAAVEARHRFDYWHGVACQKIVPHEAKPLCRSTFEAGLHSGALLDIGLFIIHAAPMKVAVQPRHHGCVTADDIFVCRPLKGELHIEQGGRATLLRAGDFTVLDPMIPYTGEYIGDSSLLMLKVPRRTLESRVGPLRKLTGIAFTGDKGHHVLTSSYLEMLPTHSGVLSTEASTLVREQTLDLLGLCLASASATKEALSSSQSLVSMRIGAAVEALLQDPDLDVSTVARRAGVSVRYANEVLARNGTSLSRLILTRRLARCRQALEDPGQHHRTVSEIAYGWGFSDLTHFGRRFRDAFGMPPSEYRRQSVG